MERERIIRERFKVFKTLMNYGYDMDYKIIRLNTDELVEKTNLDRSEIAIAIGIKKALKNGKLVTYLNGLEGLEDVGLKKSITKDIG